MNNSVKRIALIGPESTGKTTLSTQLAEHFKTTWVPEYARNYIKGLNRKYTLEDILYCAKKQLEEEEKKAAVANQFLFCDTELITAKVWCEDLYKTVPDWIQETLLNHAYDLFLLTYYDIPFEKDSVRENPHRREFFFNWYEKELIQNQFPYIIIKGIGKERLQQAIEAILNSGANKRQ